MDDWAKSMQVDKAKTVLRLPIYERNEKLSYEKNYYKVDCKSFHFQNWNGEKKMLWSKKSKILLYRNVIKGEIQSV